MAARDMRSSKRSDGFSPSRLSFKDPPVSVEVKKPKRLAVCADKPSETISERRRSEGDDAKLPQATRSVHHRSRTAYAKNVPWVPAPAKSQRSSRITWEADKAVLEIPYPDKASSPDAPMDRNELGTQHEDDNGGDADGNRSDVSLPAAERHGDRHRTTDSPAGSKVEETSAASIGRSPDRYAGFAENVAHKFQREIEDLRRTVDSLRAESEASRRESRVVSSERDQLLNRVAEMEVASSHLRGEHLGRPSFSASTGGGGGDGVAQRDALLLKLSEFEETNRLLRRLLEEQRNRTEDAADSSERHSALVERLSASSEENVRLRAQLLEQEKRVLDLRIQLEAAQEEQLKVRSLQTSLEQTRAHLQRELRSREGDCNRMAVQIRALESRVAQEKVEVDHLQELLRQAHTKYDQDKDALKKAARLQKQRATETTGAAEQLSSKLAEKEQMLADAMLARDAQRNRAERLATEVATLTNENSSLKKQLSEQAAHHSATVASYQEKIEALSVDLHLKSSEVAAQQAESQRQTDLAATLERRALSAEELVASLRADNDRLEALCAETDRSLTKTKQIAAETSEQLAEQKHLVERVRADADAELDDVRQRLMARLGDLEPLPDTLRAAELRRSAAEERVIDLERQSTEAVKAVAHLTDKADTQAREIASWKEKYQTLEVTLQGRITQLQSRLSELETKSSDLSSVAARRDDALTIATQRAEQLVRDNAALASQLDAALADARRAHEEARERGMLKEKSMSERVRELDEQLVAAKSDAARARREREDAERKLGSRLADLKDRLEQSHSTNRSMQNYVQFLKNSYASVFGDVSVAAGAVATMPVATSSPVASHSYTSAFQ